MNIVIHTIPVKTPGKPDFDRTRSLEYTIKSVKVKEVHEKYVFITLDTLEEFLKLGVILQRIRIYYEISFKERGYKISMFQLSCFPE